MTETTESPMIHTSKGNLPIADLERRVTWTDDVDTITCCPELWLGDECVKREVHILQRKGFEALGASGAI